MENDVLINLILQAIVCWFFYKLGQASIIKAISKDLLESLKAKGISVGRNADGNIEFTQHIEEVILEIERVGSQYFAYNDEGKFLGQGLDFKELFQTLKSRYPGQNFRIQKDQKTLSEEEVGQMVKVIFEVFGDKVQENANNQSR